MKLRSRVVAHRLILGLGLVLLIAAHGLLFRVFLNMLLPVIVVTVVIAVIVLKVGFMAYHFSQSRDGNVPPPRDD